MPHASCNEDDPDYRIGSPNDDTMHGTPADEVFCGLGGDDTIIGGGGQDKIWGGLGDDHIEGGSVMDFIYGGEGNDVLLGNNRGVPMETKYDQMWGDAGNDVLRGGTISPGEYMRGGVGNDLLAPTPASVFHSYLDAGEGNDVVVALNFSIGGDADVVDLNGKREVQIPIPNSLCSVKIQMSQDSKKGSVSCDIPWPKLSGIPSPVTVGATTDDQGNVTFDMTLLNELGKLTTDESLRILEKQTYIGKDVCICDPLFVATRPEQALLPRDAPI